MHTSVTWPKERVGWSVVMKVIGEGAEGPRGWAGRRIV